MIACDCSSYAAPLYVDISKITRTQDADDMEDEQQENEEIQKIFIGQVRCHLSSVGHVQFAGADHAAIREVLPFRSLR